MCSKIILDGPVGRKPTKEKLEPGAVQSIQKMNFIDLLKSAFNSNGVKSLKIHSMKLIYAKRGTKFLIIFQNSVAKHTLKTFILLLVKLLPWWCCEKSYCLYDLVSHFINYNVAEHGKGRLILAFTYYRAMQPAQHSWATGLYRIGGATWIL